MLDSRDDLRQALAAFAPAPFPIGKQPLQDRGMSRLKFREWRKVLQLLPQQGVQLEALPVAIQHPQQRRIDKPVARIAPRRGLPSAGLCWCWTTSGKTTWK